MDPHQVDDLRAIYRAPSQRVIDKVAPSVGAESARFIARSPLFIIASTDGTEVDASPRGGPPGFVTVIDEHTLAFADLTGNNRLDTFTNVQAVASVGLIFIVPGAEETVRVNGKATLTTDEQLRAQVAIGDRIPKVAMRIAVDECYLHCGAALRRAEIWNQQTWPDAADRPTGGAILAEVFDAPGSADEIDEGLADYYDNGVWEVGGAN